MKPEEVLKHYNIDFVTKHPAVSNKCVAGVCCPFCEENNYHLGIFKDTGFFSCWKCGTKGSLFKLVQKITGTSHSEYQKVSGIPLVQGDSVKSNLDNIFKKEEKIMEKINTVSFKGLIKVTIDTMPNIIGEQMDNFLIERKFTYEMMEKYSVYYGIAGNFKQHLVIPIIEFGKVVGFIGRSMEKETKNKYYFNPGFRAADHLYIAGDTKSFGTKMGVVVEGVFDAWAVSLVPDFVGVAAFGSNISTTQLWKLADLVNNIVYMPDADVPAHKVLKTHNMLKELFDVVLLQCPTGDPCSLHQEGKLRHILEEL